MMTKRLEKIAEGTMPRVNAIWHHPLYQENYKRIQEIEKDRVFCCHGMIHLLDVARLAYIRNLEQGLGYKKELLYAAAILHDIGKAYQYEEKIPHEIVGEEIAAKILKTLPEDVAFSEEECKLILQAVRGHRCKREYMEQIEELFYDCDKRSRNCFACPAEKECNWSEEEKNWEIKI